jgi:hypothetical protein
MKVMLTFDPSTGSSFLRPSPTLSNSNPNFIKINYIIIQTIEDNIYHFNSIACNKQYKHCYVYGIFFLVWEEPTTESFRFLVVRNIDALSVNKRGHYTSKIDN